MNRRDIKYLESAENKENDIVVDYNGPVEENMTPKPTEENNLYIDESLGITPLSGNNDTCYTEAFNIQLTSSTPMTNHFRQSYKVQEGASHYPNQCVVPQTYVYPLSSPVILLTENISLITVSYFVFSNSEAPNVEADDKLSVILESTREYISSSSGSSTHTRNTALGFTLTKEDLVPIKEQSISKSIQTLPLFFFPNVSCTFKQNSSFNQVKKMNLQTLHFLPINLTNKNFRPIFKPCTLKAHVQCYEIWIKLPLKLRRIAIYENQLTLN